MTDFKSFDEFDAFAKEVAPMARRRFLQMSGAILAAGTLPALVPATARAQEKTLFRMDKNNSFHYLHTHFIDRFLSVPMNYDSREFTNTGQARISAFIRGAIDGVATSWTYLIQLVDDEIAGSAVSGVASGGSRLVVTKGKENEIKTLADLKGRKVGVVQFSSQDIMMIYALSKLGIDAFKEVNRVNVGNPGGVVSAVATNQVDAAAIWEPFASIIVIEHGAKTLSRLTPESFGESQGGFYIRDEYIQKHPDIVQDIVSALVKATEWSKKNQDELKKLAMQVTGQKAEVMDLALKNTVPMFEMPMSTLRLTATSMHKLGIRKRDVASLMDKKVVYDFLAKATGKSKEQLGYAA